MLDAAGAFGKFIVALFLDVVVGAFLFAAQPLIVEPGNAIYPGYGALIWLILLIGGLVSPWIVMLKG